MHRTIGIAATTATLWVLAFGWSGTALVATAKGKVVEKQQRHEFVVVEDAKDVRTKFVTPYRSANGVKTLNATLEKKVAGVNVGDAVSASYWYCSDVKEHFIQSISVTKLTGSGKTTKSDKPTSGAKLKKLLAAYDRSIKARGSAQTVPIEMEIDRLRRKKQARVLEAFLTHRRFGSAVLWALSEIRDPKSIPAVVKALQNSNKTLRAGLIYLPGFGVSKDLVTFLKTRMKVSGIPLSPALATRFRGCLIAAGDEDALGEVKKLLADKDPDVKSMGAVTLGYARNVTLCAELLAEALDDKRAVEKKIRSAFVQTIKTDHSTTTKSVEIKTVRDAVVEAFNLAARKPFPLYFIMLWQNRGDPRKPPFGCGVDAVGKIRKEVEKVRQPKQETN